MDSYPRCTPLGALVLALALIAAAAVLPLPSSAGAFRSSSPSNAGLELPADLSSRVSVALGWPVSPQEADPQVWALLPGVGPILANRLAAVARVGELRVPEHLLRVEGIGFKMTVRLTPLISWNLPDESLGEPGPGADR